MLLQSFQFLLQPLWDYWSYPTAFCTIMLHFILHIASNSDLSSDDSWKSLFTNINVILRIHQWPPCSGKCILTTPCDLLFGKERPATGKLSSAGRAHQKSPVLCGYLVKWKCSVNIKEHKIIKEKSNSIYFTAKSIPILILPCYFMHVKSFKCVF